MAGLFDQPNMLRLKELSQLQSQAGSRSEIESLLTGSFFGLGNAGGNAALRLLGVDTRSEGVKQAAEVQDNLSGLDLTDRSNILERVQRLSQNGLHSQAAQLMQLLPQLPKPADVDRSFQDLWNPEKQVFEKHLFENGVDRGVVGIDSLPKKDDVKEHAWQSIGTVRLPDGVETSARFNPGRQGIDALQVRIGDEWITAPAGVQRIQNRRDITPISKDPTKLTISFVNGLIEDDPELGAFISGLSKKDKVKFSNRVVSLGKKLMRDDKSLDTATAIDKAFLQMKESGLKTKTLFGFPFDTSVKTPEELTTSDDGFRIVR